MEINFSCLPLQCTNIVIHSNSKQIKIINIMTTTTIIIGSIALFIITSVISIILFGMAKSLFSILIK